MEPADPPPTLGAPASRTNQAHARARRRPGLAERLVLAFGILLSLLGLASWSALAALDEMHDSLHQVARREESVQAALELASAVRDQYAHQAHTIIIGDTSHLGFYQEARDKVVALVRKIRAETKDEQVRSWCEEMERSSSELDRVFEEEVVPAVLSGQTARIREKHAAAQELVSRTQQLADRLARHFEAEIRAFDAHANVVQHAAFRRMLVVFGSSAAAALAIAFYLVRLVRKPMERLEAGAERVAAGQLDTVIEVAGPEDFARLAARFNTMTAALKRNQERLVQTEKMAGIGRLAAGVAHEINNPLGVILGYVRVMKRSASGEVASDLSVLEDEAVRCQEIVEGLLDLSRPQEIDPVAVNLGALSLEVVDRLRTLAEPSPSMAVAGTGTAQGHPVRLRQIIANLVRNAAEAAGPTGNVSVNISQSAEEVRVEVRDDGPGISPELRSRLFEPFFTTKAKGTGLGLALSQALAQAHRGRIEVEHSPPRGTLFRLVLPSRSEVTA